jgi:hypothetical protein
MLAAPAAAITGTLDQYQTNISTYPLWASEYTLAQSFTPSRTGPLTAFGIYASPYCITCTPTPGSSGSVTVTIDGTANHQPDGFPLDSMDTAIPITDGGEWVYFSWASAPILTAGQEYIFIMTVHSPWGMEWLGDCTDIYSRGRALVRRPYDPFWLTVSQWDSLVGSTACMGDFSFRAYLGATPTATPVPTPPPVATATRTRTPAPGATTAPHATATGTSTLAPGATPAAAAATSTATPGAGVAGVAGVTAAPTDSAGSGSSGGSSSGSSALILAALAVIAAGGGIALFLWRFRPRP